MKKRTATLLLLLPFSNQALASGYVTAKVASVRVDQTGKGMVMFDQAVGGQPASCRHSAYENALAFDSNTPGGKAILAMALSAKAIGNTLLAYGTGTCTIYSGSWVEDWNYGIVQ